MTEDLLLLLPPRVFSNNCDNTATASTKIFSSGGALSVRVSGLLRANGAVKGGGRVEDGWDWTGGS